MTAFALLTGQLFRAPERKTSAAGKSYAIATLKVAAGNASDFWRLLAFSEAAQTELMRLVDGDKLSAQGTLKIDLYRANDGTDKISRTLLVDGVLALRPPPREKISRSQPSAQAPVATASNAERDTGDALPF